MHSTWKLDSSELLIPISPDNNLLKHRAIFLPTVAEKCADVSELVTEIEAYIDRYVDLSPRFRTIASHYVLLSWVYGAFNELPYLRFRGEPGSGKTRALIVIGSICYQAFLASGASTVSPIFHTLDAFRGTFVFDEADFRFSNEKMELVKLLNNGNVRGFPLFRSVPNQRKEYDPKAFHVFGPKIVAMRHGFEDRALESRFLTEEMGQRPCRSDIPINLPDVQFEEAQALRNRLLGYRFAHLATTIVHPEHASASLSARANQILIPLLSVTENKEARSIMLDEAVRLEAAHIGEKSALPEAHLLEVLAELIEGGATDPVAVTVITTELQKRFGAEYDRAITARYVGSLLRKRLHFTTYKTSGVYVLPLPELERIATLCQKFGVRRD